MKKILAVLFAIILLAGAVLTANAKAADVGLSVTYYKTDKGNIIAYASIIDIMDPNGLCDIEYEVKFDSTKLEFVYAEVNMPKQWKQFQKDEYAEDLSYKKDDNTFIWCVLNTVEGYGVKENDEFYIKIEFKPLTNEEANVDFNCHLVVNDKVEEISGTSQTLVVNKPTENNNSTESSEGTDSDSSNTEVSNIEGPTSNDTENSAPATSEGNNTANNSQATDNADQGNENDKDYTVFYVTAIAAVVVIGAVVCLFILRKKGKN